MHNRVTGLGSIFLVSAVIGCGGASGKPTNLPPTTKLMALTPAQQTQICNDFSNYSLHNLSTANFCKYAGIATADVLLASDSSTPDTTLQGRVRASSHGVQLGRARHLGRHLRLQRRLDLLGGRDHRRLQRLRQRRGGRAGCRVRALPPCQTITKSWLNANGDTAGQIYPPASCLSLAAKCPGISM